MGQPQLEQRLDSATTEQIQDWFNLVLWGRVAAVARQSSALLEAERQQQALRERRWKRRLKLWQEIMLLVNFYSLMLLLMGLSAIAGTLIGINVPEGIICHSRHSLCWHLRFRHPKQIVE